VNRKNSLRELRLTKGVTLRQLAQKTGYKYSYLVQLEKGVRKGTPNTWLRLARELQIPVKDLFREAIGEYNISANKTTILNRLDRYGQMDVQILEQEGSYCKVT